MASNRAEKMVTDTKEFLERVTRFFIAEHGCELNVTIGMSTDGLPGYKVEAEGTIYYSDIDEENKDADGN